MASTIPNDIPTSNPILQFRNKGLLWKCNVAVFEEQKYHTIFFNQNNIIGLVIAHRDFIRLQLL